MCALRFHRFHASATRGGIALVVSTLRDLAMHFQPQGGLRVRNFLAEGKLVQSVIRIIISY